MRNKLNTGEYKNLDAMEKDFDLMIANCLAYNDKDTMFYKYDYFLISIITPRGKRL